jgi:magnesium-transporting ATPase (P-type)
LIGAVSLAVTLWAWKTGQPEWRSVAMTSVVLLQMLQAHASRSLTVSAFALSPWSNRALLAASVGVLVMQAAVVFFSPLHGLFGTAGLTGQQTAILLAAGLFVLLVVEGAKHLGRRGARS